MSRTICAWLTLTGALYRVTGQRAAAAATAGGGCHGRVPELRRIPGDRDARPGRRPVRADDGIRGGHRGFFALGAYLGRNLRPGWAIVGFIAAFACLISMNVTVRRSGSVTAGLFAVGVLLGVAVAPTIAYDATTNPRVLWQVGAADRRVDLP
jgi:hypothetical protein